MAIYLRFGSRGQAYQERWFAAAEMLVVVEHILKHYDWETLDVKGLLAKPLSEQVMFHVYKRSYNAVIVSPVHRAK